MTPPNDAVLAKVREWIELADDDLRVAQHTLTITRRCPYRLVAYHAQQCAEKYLKAFLVLRGVDFPHTHNIARLRKLCVDLASWAEDLRDADELTEFAITSRYPGHEMKVTATDAQVSIRIAEVVRETVRRALSDEAVQL